MRFALKGGIDSMIFTYFKGEKNKFLQEETSVGIADSICFHEKFLH